MFNFKREHKHPLLITLAILALLVFGAIYLCFSVFSFSQILNDSSNFSDGSDNLSLKNEGDPMITKVPGLEDYLDGPIISATDPSLGATDAKVNIVQFSDFSCDFCQRQEEVTKKLLQKYGGQVKFIRKDYPESDSNSTSYQAALTGRCAQIQGKFWEYRDQIYKNKGNLNPKLISDAANAVKLNKSQLADCLKSELAQALVNDNITEANALKITGVPFIFVNKQEIMGEVSLEDLESMIETELAK